jgi:serine/threonine protein kinase
MPLSTGTRLGPHEVLSAIGAGGMGEVYRARDTKLNSDAAIKVLLPSVANDPERLARFSREAQVLAFFSSNIGYALPALPTIPEFTLLLRCEPDPRPLPHTHPSSSGKIRGVASIG